MEDSNSDEWLPPGWTVEVRVRKNGQRDKYYFAPLGGLKLKSRVEVFRHLDYSQNKVSIKKISDNVVVKEVIAEGLPPGWVKKTRITTKEDTIRKDSYYIDPVSGYAFRSLKDVDRYLESDEIGRNTFKPKDGSDLMSKPDKFSSAGVTSNPTSSVSMGLSSDMDLIANDHQIPKPAFSGEHMPTHVPISEHISSRCVADTKFISSVLSQAEGSDQKEGPFVLAESNVVPICTDDAQERQLEENAQTKHGTEKARSYQHKRRKKEINLPRRASKRLAGIKVDPIPEIYTRSRARQVAAKQSGEEKSITNKAKSPNNSPSDAAKQINTIKGGLEECLNDGATNTPKSGQGKHFYGKLSTPEKPDEGIAEEHGSNHVTILESGEKIDGKLDYSLDYPLGELLTDPCIAFAIQTLTGVTFETSKNTRIPSELTNSDHPKTSAAAEGYDTRNIAALNMLDVDDKEGCNVFSPAENFAIRQQHADAGGPEIIGKSNVNNTGSSSGKTLDISWMDPCIEFAIKTLTGTAPLDSDLNPKNCLQQQQHSDMALSSVSLDNLCQTDHYSIQYFGTQKPMFKQQQSFVDPTLQQTRNAGIGNSAGARLPHRGDERRNFRQR
ncbi:PREDICTED: uncharacterized protein LOC109363276 isoform X2 [Lupinus angustifolius]|uniref:uncharacterized protein LOC109363276 isoform X2 n=1 Tax=Lupinus angustifolius TaxID=3871 RepID=UPI00092EF81F|nr:PREDICTED: uncharacterized protein LOC109363276 isoform X2 [Lupinus angustifolius]